MRHLQKILLALLIWEIAATGNSSAQLPPGGAETIISFRFQPGEDRFILDANEAELSRLYALVDEYRTQIDPGEMPVRVDGYCASLTTSKENLTVAFVRANRVKSELITNKGLKEADFVTANYAHAYHRMKDVVVVTLRIPAETQPQPGKANAAATGQRTPETSAVKEPEPQPEPEWQAEPVSAAPDAIPAVVPTKPYCFALRTNLLYDAFLLPTLGAEWRINRNIGVKLDGSFSWWNDGKDKVQKVWLVNPEVRWYLLDSKRFYVGASGSYGEYNIYKYMLGGIVSKDTGYQGKLWNAGLTAGYQLYISRGFSVDFNLGLGYTRSKYDSFGMTDGVRVYKERDKTKNFWGPTQAGISLIWSIGRNK